MAKKPYVPAPWLREDLGPSKVRIPPAIVGALYQLQKDEQEVEYGGAIDFELVKEQPAVEKILTYTGAVRAIPGYIWERVFMNPDIEFTFHTHPMQHVAIASEGDVVFFLTTTPNAMLIVAGTEAILLTKGKNTPPPKEAIKYYEETQLKAARAAAARYLPARAKEDQAESIRELKRLLDIDSVVFPIDKPVDVMVKIVREIAKGKEIEMFSGK